MLQYFQSSIKYWISSILNLLLPSIHDIQLLTPFNQFGDNDDTKEINISEFWKINLRTRFDLIKMPIAGSVEVFIAVWSRYITLKLLWKTLKYDAIKGPLFHTFHQAFYKNFAISVFRNRYSPFVPIFIKWFIENLARYKESCISI